MSEEWRNSSRESQQTYSNLLGDRVWDRFALPSELQELRGKIAFAIGGPPRDENNNHNFGFTSDEIKIVDDIKKKCIKYCKKQGWDDVFLGIIFSTAWKNDSTQATLPIFRIKHGDGRNICNSYFIDHCGRVYNTWKDFLDKNIFDGWWICVPDGALYPDNGQEVRLEFRDQTGRGEVLEGVDVVSSISNIVTSLTMTAGVVMTFIPPVSAFGAALTWSCGILGAPGAAYGAGRSVCTLVDRGTHEQSISLLNSEARACWMNTAASVLSVGVFASTKILATAAKSGSIASSGLRAFCTTLNVTCLSMSGVGILNSVYELSKKDKYTTLDVVQLTTSIFFFTHSAISFKTASGIIKDAQNKALLKEKQNLSPTDQSKFDKMLQGRKEMVSPGKVRNMHGNAEFIRDLKNISNKQEFFKHFEMIPDGQFNINNEVILDAKAFLQMNEAQRDQILKNSDDLKNGRIDVETFNENVGAIQKNYRITFSRQRAMGEQKIKEAFGVSDLGEVQIGNKNIFQDLKPHEIDRLNNVLRESGKNYNQDCIRASRAVADKMGCKNVTEFTAVSEYTNRQLDVKIQTLMKENSNPQRPTGTKAKDFYKNQVYHDFMSSNQAQTEIVQNFNDLRSQCDAANQAGTPRFANSFAAANHYDKHPYLPKVDPNNNLSPSRYFEIARDITSGLVEPIWTQDGSSLMCKFMSEQYGATAVRFDNLANGTSVIATLLKANVPSEVRQYNE